MVSGGVWRVMRIKNMAMPIAIPGGPDAGCAIGAMSDVPRAARRATAHGGCVWKDTVYRMYGSSLEIHRYVRGCCVRPQLSHRGAFAAAIRSKTADQSLRRTSLLSASLCSSLVASCSKRQPECESVLPVLVRPVVARVPQHRRNRRTALAVTTSHTRTHQFASTVSKERRSSHGHHVTKPACLSPKVIR